MQGNGKKKAIRPVPYGYGLRFFKSYQYAALFGVKTAQTAEGMNLDLHIFVRLQDPCLQLPGGRFVLAVTEADLARAESLSGQLGHQCLQGTCLPTALVHGLQGALVAGLSYDADAGNAYQLCHQGGYPAVVGKGFQRFQHKYQAGFPHIACDEVADILVGHAAFHTFLQLFDYQSDLGAGGEGVQHKDPLSLVLRFVDLLRGAGGVVTAGQAACDGYAKNIVCVAEGRQPVAGVGAGGFGFSLVMIEVLHHGVHIQGGIVHKFPLRGDDFHGSAGEGGVLQSKQIAG